MKLDYQITHIQHPHLEKLGWVYTYVSSYVWISNLKLISELNKQFNLNLEPEENTTVSKELADNIWKFVDHKLGYVGMYGNEYDRDMYDMYKDYDKSGEYTL
jgi:hypothetical protein